MHRYYVWYLILKKITQHIFVLFSQREASKTWSLVKGSNGIWIFSCCRQVVVVKSLNEIVFIFYVFLFFQVIFWPKKFEQTTLSVKQLWKLPSLAKYASSSSSGRKTTLFQIIHSRPSKSVTNRIRLCLAFLQRHFFCGKHFNTKIEIDNMCGFKTEVKGN